MLKKRVEYRQDYLDATNERYTMLIEKLKGQLDEYNAGRRSVPPVLDYLVISGGGDWGAFGAGFLKGWRKIPKTDPLARPRFDVVTGVSTGALIAPFAYLDDAGADEKVERLYRNPRTDWVKERWPIYFMPYNISFDEVPGLERDLKATISLEMIGQIGQMYGEGRLLFVNATNLDDGSPHVFYLLPEARRAVEKKDPSRFHNILLASSGIPGAFPYREIDGAMYVDGGVTANMIFGGRLPEENRLPAVWQRKYPGVPMPKLRYWVIFNNQLHAQPLVVPATWHDIVVRAIEVSTRASSLNAMRQLFLMAEVARMKWNADVEVRIAAIPDEWRAPKPDAFDKATMNSLADLGEKMGADRGSWITEPPTQ
jgi:hypothetical protein